MIQLVTPHCHPELSEGSLAHLNKFEIRISKLKTISKFEITKTRFEHYNFGNLNLFRISCFGFRI